MIYWKICTFIWLNKSGLVMSVFKQELRKVSTNRKHEFLSNKINGKLVRKRFNL